MLQSHGVDPHSFVSAVCVQALAGYSCQPVTV